jgi:hypothetical protein
LAGAGKSRGAGCCVPQTALLDHSSGGGPE